MNYHNTFTQKRLKKSPTKKSYHGTGIEIKETSKRKNNLQIFNTNQLAIKY